MRPERDIERLQSEIEDLLAELWSVPRFAGARRAFRPRIDAYRCEEPPRITVVVELAGVDPADVQIDGTARTLVVRGVRRRPPVEGRYHVMELDYGPFERTLRLAEDVDVAAATASYERGLLTIVLPLAAARPSSRPIAIEVRGR